MPRLLVLGGGAMNSPRYRPAGLLVVWANQRVMLDGGGATDRGCSLDGWLVSDEQAELMPQIHGRAAELGVSPAIRPFEADSVWLRPLPVRHTSHPASAI